MSYGEELSHKNITLSVATLQKEKRQEIQKSKEPGMGEEGTLAWWNLMVAADILDQDQEATLLGVGGMEVDVDLRVATLVRSPGYGGGEL